VAPFDAKQAKQYQQAWAKYLGVPIEITNSIGMKLVLIPPGEFDMGSTEQEVEELRAAVKAANIDANWKAASWGDTQIPRHHVRITRSFYLGKYEATDGQFRVFAQTAQYQTDAEKQGKATTGIDFATAQLVPNTEFTWQKQGFPQSADHPAGCLSWDDALAFSRWLSEKEKEAYRLPTEAEWEYACRAGTTTTFFTGDHPRTLRGFANLSDLALKKVFPQLPAWVPWNDRYAYTAPVGQFRPNAFGVHDMVGNVCEFCADWYAADYYARSPKDDPPGPETGSARVVRGSAWVDLFGGYFGSRSAHRGGAPGNNPATGWGFRVVKVIAPP
jgi:formylglycine-generating enzyme required for sulfatase activity